MKIPPLKNDDFGSTRSDCRLASGEPCPNPPVGFAGTIMRLIPMGSSMFVAYFGTKISTMVRVCSVFVASCTPVLNPVLKQIKTEGGVSAETFVGVGGALYVSPDAVYFVYTCRRLIDLSLIAGTPVG